MFNSLIFQSLAPTPPELVSACRSDFTRASWLVRQVWKIFQTNKSFNVEKSFRSAWLWGHGLANPDGLGRAGLPHRLRPLPLLPLAPPGHVPPPALLVPPVPPAPGVKYFLFSEIFSVTKYFQSQANILAHQLNINVQNTAIHGQFRK